MDPIISQENLRIERSQILGLLNIDPETVVRTFYSYRNGRLYSPYLSVNKPFLCCLLEKKPIVKNVPSICSTPPQEIARSKTGTIYKVGTSKESYVVKILPVNVSIELREESSRYINRLKSYSGKCGFPANFPRYSIASDDFTNEVLVGYILDYVLNMPGVYELGLNNIVTTYTASICDKTGIILQEKGETSLSDVYNPLFQPYQELSFAVTGNIPIFNEEFILNTVGQIVILLSYLHEWDFIHGDLKISNVVFFPTPYRYYPAPFTVKIIDFEKSSITFPLQEKDYRFYNNSSLARPYLTVNPFIPELKDDSFTLDHFFVSQIYADSRHSPVPYYSAFDIYTLIVSMMLSPSFFTSFSRFPDLITRIWGVLFDPPYLLEVYNTLHYSQGKLNPNSMSDVIGILKNIPLKCNALQLLYNSIFNP